jgi:hypothetical protein
VATEVRILPPPLFFEALGKAGIAQLAERKPSKLRVAGSNPVSRSVSARRSCLRSSGVEHLLGKEGVTGSIPVEGSGRLRDAVSAGFGFCTNFL